MIIFLKKIVKCLCFSGELSTVIKMLGTEVFKFEVLFIVSLCEVSMLRSKSLVFHLPGQSLRIAMLRYSLGRPADFHADIFFQLFLLPQKMCLHHPGGFFELYFMYSIAQHSIVFMVFCHENKVCSWVLVLVNQGQVPPLGNTTISVGMDTFYALCPVDQS